MKFEAFEKFIVSQDLVLRSMKSTLDYTDRERTFARMIKLGEEYGELCDQVLAGAGDQRKNKLALQQSTDLGDEFADVVITAFLLAKSLDLDIMQAMDHKIAKIQARNDKPMERR